MEKDWDCYKRQVEEEGTVLKYPGRIAELEAELLRVPAASGRCWCKPSRRDMTTLNDIERDLGDAVADGRINASDADAVRDFAAFLADPEVGIPPTAPGGKTLPMSALRRHRDTLGLSDDDLRQAARDRGIPDGTETEAGK